MPDLLLYGNSKAVIDFVKTGCVVTIQLMQVQSIDDAISLFLPTPEEPFKRQFERSRSKQFLRDYFAKGNKEFQPISLLGISWIPAYS